MIKCILKYRFLYTASQFTSTISEAANKYELGCSSLKFSKVYFGDINVQKQIETEVLPFKAIF